MPMMTTLSEAEKIRLLRRHISDTVLDEHARHADDQAWHTCPMLGCVAARDVLQDTT